MAHSKATFAAGCIWGAEAAFRELAGVTGTRVGFTGVHKVEASASHLGRVKAVEVRFDPARTSFAELLEVFWQNHDRGELNASRDTTPEPDKSAIFYHDSDQRNEAIAAKIMLERSGRFAQGVSIEILPAAPFFPTDSMEAPSPLTDGEARNP